MKYEPAALADEFGEYSLKVMRGDHIGQTITLTGRPYEARLLSLAKLLLSPGDQVIDVGANIGNHSVAFARHGCEVTAIEPNLEAYSLLLENIQQNASNILVHQVGLSCTTGMASVSVRIDGNLGSAALHPDPLGTISVTTLDAMEIRSPRLIKIDVEGSELCVLEGGRDTIRRWNPLILVELQTRTARSSARAFLGEFGYRLLPVSFSGEPTFLFWKERADAMRIICSHTFAQQATRRAFSKLRHIHDGQRGQRT